MSNHAYKSPTYNIVKRQRIYGTANSAECKTPSPLGKGHASSTLELDGELASPGRELFANGQLQPRHMQQRFLQKLNQERRSTKENHPPDTIAYSIDPPTYSSQRVAGNANDDDGDDMFGDDIPMEDLEEVLVMTETLQTLTHKTTQPASAKLHHQPITTATTTTPSITPPTTLTTKQNSQNDDDDNMFGDDIPSYLLDEALNTCATTTTAAATTTTTDDPSEPTPRYRRYMVANLERACYDTMDEKDLPEMILHLISEKETFAIVKLREGWLQTVIKIGDIVHIPTLATNHDNSNTMIIDNTQGFLVIHPDRLMSSTAVAESTFCLRKSVLQAKIKSIGDYSEALVHGNIIHRIIQNAMRTSDFSLEGLRAEMRRVVYSSLDELYAIDQDEETALHILERQILGIKAFGDTYVNQQHPKSNARIATDMGVNVANVMGCKTVAFSQILDVEEHLWSPTFGLKGMIDVSVEMKVHPNSKVLTVPLELKTGKSSRFISHRAQTTLYILLMADRYGIDIDAAALYYSRMNSLYIVPAMRNDLRLLLMARNSLATAIQSKQNLPPMIKNLHHCQNCSMNDACLQYHKAVENGNGDSSGLGGYFDKKTHHMDEAACNFFRHWLQLIDWEEDDIDYLRKDIWRQTAEVRELAGKCLNNMIIDPSLEQGSSSVFRFVRKDGSSGIITNSSLSVGDPIVISSIEGHINLGMGFILRMDQRSVTIDLTSPLRNVPQRGPGFDERTNQVFVQRRDVAVYRIDKDEMASGVALMRRNIVELLGRQDDGGNKHKQLIVDRRKPSFVPVPSTKMPASLNPAQQNAVEKVLSAKDYAIILGMPGTGKTTTTAHIIRTLVDSGKTVLLTSYTHSALDNVLSKVHASGIDVLRLGNPEKVMPSLRSCMPNGNPTLTTVERLETFYSSKKVVGVTCLGIGHNLLQRRRFDYCIVDEASQITLPACIGPLRCADIFVLVGDQYQLPPLIRNDVARDHGLDKSLFQLLAEDHPESVAVLEYQYRMNRDIMSISNTLIYDHKLKCANPTVASRQLQMPSLQAALAQIHANSSECTTAPCWIQDVVDPSRKVVFIDTDQIPAAEERVQERVQNTIEAALISQLSETLLAAGVPQNELAVISVYRSQLRLISHALRGRPDVEVATIDKYQGRDKECILVSLVRSNTQGNTGDLLRDWRRINVAFTRAKSKVIVIGSRRTLQSSALFKAFLQLMESNRWVYQLQPRAHEIHSIEPPPSPVKQRKEHKTFTSTDTFLKSRPILREVYNSS